MNDIEASLMAVPAIMLGVHGAGLPLVVMVGSSTGAVALSLTLVINIAVMIEYYGHIRHHAGVVRWACTSPRRRCARAVERLCRSVSQVTPRAVNVAGSSNTRTTATSGGTGSAMSLVAQ